jgi:hypothetical protein
MSWERRLRDIVLAYAALGVLNPEVRVDAFYLAVERLVLPRLTRVGLDGAMAWKTRYYAGIRSDRRPGRG